MEGKGAGTVSAGSTIPVANVTIERRGRKGRTVRQDFFAAFAAFAFQSGVSQSDTLLDHFAAASAAAWRRQNPAWAASCAASNPSARLSQTIGRRGPMLSARLRYSRPLAR